MNALITAAEKSSGGSFLVQPGIGLMVWTLVVVGLAMLILWKKAFPLIAEALDKRQKLIDESIDTAEKTKAEANSLLEENRERLKEPRVQPEDIVTRARKAAEVHEREATEEGRRKREELLAQARKDIEAETRRAIQEIRNEVASLTIQATEKVTRKTLSQDDQERLVQEALNELDFTALAGSEN